MRKKIIAWSVIFSLTVSMAPLWATAGTKPHDRTYKLPDSAVQVADDVYSLGSKMDPQSGELVEGYAFIHYKNGAAHKAKDSKIHNALTTSCFTYLARGAKWKGTSEPWLMNPSNTRGLNTSTVFSLEGQGIARWEDAADGVIGNAAGVDILGNGTSTNTTLVADNNSPDGNNEVYFANVASSGSIAVTIVWGIFSGPIPQRKLVEWDQVYDDVDFDWSAQASGVAGKMDFDNIATHELGHSVGMGHPSNSCTEETMYAFADFGETKKRDLNTGDINGINQLY